MSQRTLHILALGLAAGLLALSGCAATGGGTTPSGGGDALSIGVVELDRSQLFSTQQHPAIEKALTDRGWSVKFVDSAGQPAGAITAMQNFVQSKVDAIVVQTYSADQLSAGLAAAKDAGIPVFSTGGGPVEGDMAGAIEYIGAEPINDALIETIKDTPKVQLLEFGFTPGAPCRARKDDLDAKVKELPGVTVTERELKFPGADQVSQEGTTGWLQSNPEGSADKFVIWVCTSDALGGVLAAEQQLGRGPYDVWTWDLSEPAIEALRAKKVAGVLYLPADATSEQLADLIAEQHAAGDSWKPKTVAADAVVVTPENVEQYASAK